MNESSINKDFLAPWISTVEKEDGFDMIHDLRIRKVPYCPMPVARGLWHKYSTSGFPLGESFAKLLEIDLYPDWAYLVVEMCAEGWRLERIENFIAQEMEGVYPPEVAARIRTGLHRLCA